MPVHAHCLYCLVTESETILCHNIFVLLFANYLCCALLVSSGRKCHQTMSLWFCGVWIDQAILKLKHQTFWKSDQVWWSYGILNTTRFRKFCTTLQYKHIVFIWPQLGTFLACFKPIFWDKPCFCVSLWGLWYIYNRFCDW